MGHLGHRGCRRGERDLLQPARSPALCEGAGDAMARPGRASGRPGEFSGFQEAILGAIFDFPSTTFGPPWLFGGLNKPRTQRSRSKLKANILFSGSAAVAAGHLVSDDPGGVPAWGAL